MVSLLQLHPITDQPSMWPGKEFRGRLRRKGENTVAFIIFWYSLIYVNEIIPNTCTREALKQAFFSTIMHLWNNVRFDTFIHFSLCLQVLHLSVLKFQVWKHFDRLQNQAAFKQIFDLSGFWNEQLNACLVGCIELKRRSLVCREGKHLAYGKECKEFTVILAPRAMDDGWTQWNIFISYSKISLDSETNVMLKSAKQKCVIVYVKYRHERCSFFFDNKS